MRILGMILLVSALATSAHAESAMRSQVVELLSAYEDPTSAAEWRALGAGAGAELYTLAQDPTLSRTQRAGAVYALGFFPTVTHRAFLVALVSADTSEALSRRKAAYALGTGWGDSAVPELTHALASPDTQLRTAAARALGRVATPGARSALRARLDVETDAAVRSTMSTALSGK